MNNQLRSTHQDASPTVPSRWYGDTNWFSLPRTLRYDDRLTHADIHVLLAISSFDMKNGKICPPRWQLTIYTKITQGNISRRTANLAALGWLTIIPRDGYPNEYKLHIPEYVINKQQEVEAAIQAERKRRYDKSKKKRQAWAIQNDMKRRQPEAAGQTEDEGWDYVEYEDFEG